MDGGRRRRDRYLPRPSEHPRRRYIIQNRRLRDFTPAANNAAAAISRNFQWTGHYLK
jgi:hypothetical protein